MDMRQFQVIRMGRRIALVRNDTSRWDYFWGFSRFLRWLP